MAYHPQTNSQIERINQEVEVFLWYYINQIKQLSVTEFQYNDKKYSAIQYIPF